MSAFRARSPSRRSPASGLLIGTLAGIAFAMLETWLRYNPSRQGTDLTFDLTLPLLAGSIYVVLTGSAGLLHPTLGALILPALWLVQMRPDLGGLGLVLAAVCLGMLGERARRTTALGLVVVTVFLGFSVDMSKQVPEISESDDRPDVLLVVLDTVGARMTSLHGYQLPTTPCLEKLAEEGVWYRRAVAPAPWTVPTHASLFTGLTPRVAGCHHEHPKLPVDVPTLAERFAAAGYRTGAFLANPWVGRFNGITRGFQHEEALWERSRAIRSFLAFRLAARLLPPQDKGGSALVPRAIEWWDPGQRGPSFVFINLMEAHSPFHQVPEPNRFGVADPAMVGERTHRAQMQGVESFDYPLPGETGDAQRLHAAGVRYLDELVEKILETLRARGRLDHTIVAVTSDHGEGFGEHGFHGHMVGLYSETLHVPLVLRYPAGVEAGTVVDRVFALQDLHDLLLTLAGITEARAERLADVPKEYVISEQRRPLQVLADHAAEHSTIDKRALRVRKENLVLLRERPGNGGPPQWRFFDLDVDPREKRNLWPDPRALPLREALELFDETSIGAGVTPLIEGNLREQLHALGYLAEQ